MRAIIITSFLFTCLVCLCGRIRDSGTTLDVVHTQFPAVKISDPNVKIVFIPTYLIPLSGITFWNTIILFYRRIDLPLLANNTCIIEHEYIHVDQYRKEPILFVYKYVMSWSVERFIFHTINDNNRAFYEIPAYQREKQCLIEKKVPRKFWYLPDWAKK